MKKFVLTFLFLTLGFSFLHAQNKKADATADKKKEVAPAPTKPVAPAVLDTPIGIFKFEDTSDTYNFGEVPEGPLAEHDFVFTNAGTKEIIISEAHGSCGCTVPTFPRDTIMPGKKGGFLGIGKKKAKEYKIHVTYNTNGRQGPIMKEVMITSNAKQNPMTLHIRGYVKPKAQVDKPVPATPAPASK